MLVFVRGRHLSAYVTLWFSPNIRYIDINLNVVMKFKKFWLNSDNNLIMVYGINEITAQNN